MTIFANNAAVIRGIIPQAEAIYFDGYHLRRLNKRWMELIYEALGDWGIDSILHSAIEARHFSLVRTIVADPRLTMLNFKQTVEFAARYDIMELFDILMDNPRFNFDEALVLSAVYGRLGQVKKILARGETQSVSDRQRRSLNPSSDSNSALSHAWHEGHTKIVRELLTDERLSLNSPLRIFLYCVPSEARFGVLLLVAFGVWYMS